MEREFEKLIIKDINVFNYYYGSKLKTDITDFNPILEYILSNRGKQIRPVLGILIAKTLGEYNLQQQDFLIAIELIHNATLFHDDVIDDAKLRRNNKSLKEKYSNKIAILVGDYFLATAIKIINSLQNEKINKLFATYMQLICEGEIEQNLSLYTIPSIEKYIEKTRLKTALLFELTAYGIAVLSNENQKNNEQIKDFGNSFGILFQLKDDLNNFVETNDKPYLNDLKDGVITAPIIFTNEEFDVNILLENQKFDDIITLMKKSQAISKTQKLIEKYYDDAFTKLNVFPQNEYKDCLTELLSYFRNN